MGTLETFQSIPDQFSHELSNWDGDTEMQTRLGTTPSECGSGWYLREKENSYVW